MAQKAEIVVVLIEIILLFIGVGFAIFFIFFYSSKKKQLKEQQEQKLQFTQELSQTKSEIQDQTLNHIGRELHDNIGQLLAVAKIHSNTLVATYQDEKQQQLDHVLDKIIEETRLLSHTLNTERSEKFALIAFIEKEIQRIQATQKLSIELNISNKQLNTLAEDDAIMVFRIIQEFLSNTLKHAQASTAQIAIIFATDKTNIHLSDNGQGFDIATAKKGSGVYNIENRIKLLNGHMNLTSNTTGTTLLFSIPKKQTYDI